MSTTRKFIAINYRLPTDTRQGNSQGCWKYFTDETAARSWLNWRTGKTDTSPKGQKLYRSVEEMEKDLQAPDTPLSLKLAIQAHLKWLNT